MLSTVCGNVTSYVTGSGVTNSYGHSVCELAYHGLDEGSDPINTHPHMAMPYVTVVLRCTVCECGESPDGPEWLKHVLGEPPCKHSIGDRMLCMIKAKEPPVGVGTEPFILDDRCVSVVEAVEHGTHN